MSAWRRRPITPAPSGCAPGSMAARACRQRPSAMCISSPAATPRSGSCQRRELPDAIKTPAEDVVESCRKLAPLVVRAVYETEPLTASGAWRPWGIQVSTSFSKARALSTFARLKQRYASVLSDTRAVRAAGAQSEPRAPLALHGADRRRCPRRRRQALRRATGARRRLHRAEELRRDAPISLPMVASRTSGRHVSVAMACAALWSPCR